MSALSLTHSSRENRLAYQIVAPDPLRCIQCGICSYNCPQGVDVRLHAYQGMPVKDSRCLSCGECVRRCPRGALSFESNGLLELCFPEKID